MKGGAIPFVDDDSDDAGLMYDDIGGIAPAPFEKAPSSAPEPTTNSALPDLTPSPAKKKKSGKDVLGVTTKKNTAQVHRERPREGQRPRVAAEARAEAGEVSR